MKIFRGILAGILTICLLTIQLPVLRAQESGEDLQITAKAAILIEASTGRVIWEKNADERHYPASMTKIMTAMLGLENIGLRTEVFISPDAAETEDCFLGIKAGQRLTAEELITGMLMVSDNGAAVAVAEQVDGNVRDFAGRMNAKARELGMENTHFVNPNGLTDLDHYSTPRDIARLAKYAMKCKKFREIVCQKNRSISWTFPRQYLPVENTNELLGQYEDINGIKTGWTQAAGGCLAASARRNGIEIIAVLMQTPTPEDRFVDARKMLDYGFDRVRMVKGLSQERVTRKIWIKDGREASADARLVADICYPLINGESPENYTVTYEVPKVLAAPIKEGEVVGKAVIRYAGEPVSSVDMAVGRVEKGFSVSSWLVGLFEGVLARWG